MKSATVVTRQEGSYSMIITIPRPIVRALKIKEGDLLDVTIEKTKRRK